MRTKSEVDSHVAKVERVVTNPVEKKLKGVAFAKLYREARESTVAIKYVKDYLSVREKDHRAYNLLAELYEDCEKWEDALRQYKRSLELNSSQREVVLKVVELYSRVPLVEPERAKWNEPNITEDVRKFLKKGDSPLVWADRASRIHPGHPAVFDLRWYLLMNVPNRDYDELEDLLSEELVQRPREVSLHLKLLRIFVEKGDIEEAYFHCLSVEKTKVFCNNIDWVTFAVDVFDKYFKLAKDPREALECYMSYATTLCKLTGLHFKVSPIREAAFVFQRLDRAVHRALDLHGKNVSEDLEKELEVFKRELRGQIYFHCATYLIKLAVEHRLSWDRAVHAVCACLVASFQVKEPDTSVAWFARSSSGDQPMIWYTLACVRLSQVGHQISSFQLDNGTDWIKASVADTCTSQGQKELLELIYGQGRDIFKSFLASDKSFFKTELKIPSLDDLVKYDEVAISENPENLQLITWIALHWYRNNEYLRPGGQSAHPTTSHQIWDSCCNLGFSFASWDIFTSVWDKPPYPMTADVLVGHLFDGIALDVEVIDQCQASSLSVRDTEVFIHAIVYSSAERNLYDKDEIEYHLKPRFLPASVSPSLVTPLQEEWWNAAFGLYTGKIGIKSASKLRALVQSGLESLRVIGAHGIDPRILKYIADVFFGKANSLKEKRENAWDYQEHWESFHRRGYYYLKEALRILEIFRRDRTVPLPRDPLIPPLLKPLLATDRDELLLTIRTMLAEEAIKDGAYDSALKYLTDLETPETAYQEAQIYKTLALQNKSDTVEGLRNHLYYLRKARDKMQLCLERFGDKRPSAKKEVIEELEEITNALTEQRGIDSVPRKMIDFNEVDVEEAEEQVNSLDEDTLRPSDPLRLTLENSLLQNQLSTRNQEMSFLVAKIHKMESEIAELRMQQLGDGHVKMARSSNSSFSAPDDSSSIAQFSKEDVSNNGNVTPRLENEMSWDPFSPAPIFDKGYFAGLAESVQKIEENTELETSEQKSNNAVAVAVLQESPKTRFDDDIHVEPIVQLSERSDHVTGEENETVLFSDRAKLYRFESETSQWKERGTGDIKILFNPETQSGRILMRRDQVLRLCANHVITADMKLEPKQGRAATFMWFTLADASDDEPKPEKFTVRFKNQEIADNFKDKFIECQTLSVENTNEPKLTQADDAKTEAIKINFTPPAGSWNCNVCFVVNPKEKVKCVACQTPQYDEKENNASSSFPKFSFSNFGLQTNTSTAGPKFHFGTSPVSTSRESQDMNSTSGQLATSNTGMTFNTTPSGGFLTKSSFSQSFSSDRSSISGTPASGFQFGIPSGTLYGQESKTSQPGSNSTNDATPKFSFRFVLGQDLSPQSQAAVSTTSTSGFSSPSLFGITLQQQHSSAASSFPFLTSLLNTSAGTTSSSSNSMASTKPTLDQAQPKSAGFSFDSGFVPQAPGLSSNPFQATFVNQPAINTESMMSFPTNLNYPNTANIGGTYPTNVEPREVDEEEFFEGNWEDGHDYYYGNDDDNYYDEYYNEEDYDDDYADYYEEGEYDTYYETVMKVASKGDSEPETDSNGEVQEVGPNVGFEPVPRVVQMIDEDLFITYINKPSFTQRVKASRFMLPSTFYLYESKPSCPGCRGCKEGFTEKPVKESMGSPKNTTSAKGSSDKVQSESLKAMFAPKAGSWECPSCLIVNNQEMLSCVACKMQKPGQETAVGDTKSGFMFGSASPGGFTFGQKTPETESGARPKQESPFPIFGTSIDSASFATLAAKNESTGFGFGSCDAAKAFQGAGRQLFVTTNQDEHPEEDLGIDFKPIVQLTKVENQQTGEEGDIELFKHRAKLYRFDRTLGQWKERGAGDIKLMHNPEKKYCRVLMRRDQVHKICANHVITPDAELKSHSSSSTSWVWVATADYADEEPKPEQLTVKFKHKEDADDFKHVYDECREIMKCYLEGGVQPMSNGNFGQSNKPQNSMSNAVSNSDQGPQKEDTSIETSKSGFVFGGSGFTFGMAVQQTGNLLGKPGDGLSMFTPQTSSIQQTTASPFTSFKFGNSLMQQTTESPFTSFKFGTLPSYEANVSGKAPPSSTESILPLSGDGYNVPTETGLMTVDVVSKDFKSQFAPKPGSWECPTCMIMNPQEMIACEACHTSKPRLQTTVAQTKSAFKFGVTPTDGQSNLFSQFAPKPGSWECPVCMLPNNGNLAVCASCFTPRPGPTTDDKAKQNATPVAQSKQAFKFGVIPTEGQGNVFSQYAPKPGSWECPSCMVPNNGNLAVCASCFTPRPGPTTDDDEADQNIAFGLSAVSEQEQLLSESMLAEFAPGSWECPTCLVANTGNCPNCGACNIQKSGPPSGKTGHETMSAQFASKLGSWECPLCLIRNNGNLAACSACYTPKPGLPSFDQAVERSNPSFLFGNQSGQSSPAMFGSQSFGTGSSPAVFGSQSFETESSPAVFGSQSFGTGSQSFGTGSNLVFGSSSTSFTQNVGFTFGQSPTCVGPVGDITPTGTPKKSESQKPQSSKLSTGFAPSSLASFWSNTAGTISPFSTPSTSPSQLSKKTEPVDGKPSSTPVSKQQEATKQAPSTVFKVTSTSTSWLPSVINKGENLFSVGILNGSTSDLDQKGHENQPAASEIQRFMSPSQNTFNTPVKASGQSMAASNIFSGTKFNFSLSLTPSGSAPPKASTLSPSPTKASPIVKSPYTDSPLRDREQSFEFSPVVQLSSIEVVTGEEEEKAIYSEHAKLYRFDSESKQWKERGVGVLKLLYRESSDKYRLIMRRDQVHKLCANHIIGKKMELQSMGNSDKAFIWNTLADFSEDEAKPETFAVKFHSSDVASEFKAAFEKCVAAVGKPKYKAQRKLSLGTVQEAGKAEEQEDIQKLDENQGVKDFKQTADEDDDIQVIYELVPSEAEKQRAKKYLLPLTFYCVPSVKFDDIPKTYKADTRSSSKAIPESAKIQSPFLGSNSGSPFNSGFAGSASLSFSKLAQGSPEGSVSPQWKFSRPGKGFSGAGSMLFTSSSNKENDMNPEEEDDKLHFKPIVQLEKVEVKSGEELEEMVFCGRAKLYRFDKEGKQWKERGAGELKMLKKSDSGQVRVLMRRDQVKKVCANHFITPDMKLERSQMAQNAWIWFTHADYSEETPKAEQLLARFKSADLSQKFGQCFNEAKSSAAKVKTSSPVSAQVEDESKQTQLGSPDKQSVPDKQIGFSMFAAQPGDWTCELCYVLNTDNRPVCISCQSPNPNITQVQGFETSPRCETETSEVNLEGLVDDDNRSFILSQSKTEDVKFSPKSETSFTRMASPYQSDKALLESGSLSQRYGEESSSAQLSYPLTLNSQVGSQADTTVNDSSTFKFKSSITTTGLQVDSLGDDIEPSEVDKYFTSPGSEAEPRMKDSEIEVRLLRTPSPPNLVDSFTMTDEIIEERSESPELVITYVKEVTDYGQSKAGDMLLPQTFYSDSAADLSRSEIFESHTKVTVSSGVETQVSDEIEKHTKVAVHPSPVETPASDEIEKHTKVTVHSSPVGTPASDEIEKHTKVTVHSSPVETPASDEIEKHTKVTVHSSPVGTPASDEIEKHTKVTVRSSPVKIYVASSGQEATKTSEENTGVLNRNENTASDMHGDDVKSRVPDVPTVTLMKTEVKLKLDPTNEEPSSLEDGETLAFNRNRASESTDNTTFQFAKVPVISGRRSPMHEAVIVKEDSLEVDKEIEPREVTAHDTDELQVVFVKTPTDSQKQRALRLLLPSNFFCEPSQSPRIKTPPEPVHPNLTLTGKEIFSSGKSHPGSSGQSAIFGSSLSTGASFSFLSIASQNNPSGFKINQGHGFLGQGSALFSNFSKNSGEGAEDDSYEPSLPGFEPIVSLSKVEVSSGEEEESELFGERCKLYRFDSSAAQWKERGVGKIRILQHTNTLKSRIVMRREQVHKLCANHFITPAMSLMAKQPGQDNIWLWNTAADISEGEPKQEKFTVKFKNNDLGKRFFTVFEECKLTSSQQKDTSGTQTECQSSQTNELSSDVFTVKPRHTYWTCETCYIENDIVQGLCLGCQTPKSFGTSSPDEKGRASESTQETSVGADQHSQSPDEINEFGIPIKSEVNREKYKDIGTSIFGAGFGTGLSFSSFASMSTTSGFNATPSKTFPGAGRPVLSDKENLETEHTDDGIHVDPIIKLEKVDVTTGEEQEDVIFNSKAKMYRFDQASNQWKERGVGLLKLLRNNETRKSRLIMRRDQICKLCANHLLLPGMKLEPMPSSNRCMMWKTFADLSEGSPEECLLAVRFKTDELVAKFSAVFESLCEGRDISPELVATDGASA